MRPSGGWPQKIWMMEIYSKTSVLFVYLATKIDDKEEITTENIVAQFGFTATSAKRYLRQLTEFGYLEAHGGNKNRTYSKIIH